MVDSFLTQTATQSTPGNSILDLVLTSDSDLIGDCKVGEKLDSCDHHFIRFNIKTDFAFIENNVTIPGYKKSQLQSCTTTLTSRNLGPTKPH